MTVLVSVQSADSLLRVRRYEGQARGQVLCTHEGLYQPATVTAPNITSYGDCGPAQDRRGWRTRKAARRDNFGKQPA